MRSDISQSADGILQIPQSAEAGSGRYLRSILPFTETFTKRFPFSSLKTERSAGPGCKELPILSCCQTICPVGTADECR